MGYIFLISLIFIVIAIAKNRNSEFLKQTAFTVIVFSILNCVILERLSSTRTGSIIYLGITISNDAADLLFDISIATALISLIVYLFSDADR